ncbi:MAG: hypothetical protein AB7F89_02695 [Pirellulaceae bacterium]
MGIARQPVAHRAWDRREFLQGAAAATALAWSLRNPQSYAADVTPGTLRLGRFQFDVTPPVGHACCGGWIKPVESVDDPLEALGFVLLGAGAPIVICSVDWTGLLNEAHLEWRQALADAAGTTADRVCVQTVHQHNAPLACLETERIVAAQGDLPDVMMTGFFRECLDRGRQAVRRAVVEARSVTHVATGRGRVDRVAANRRVSRDERGAVKAMRGSACRDPELQALPEGLIDPWLKSVAFYDGAQKLVSCHYYATHPMSYYGDGRVSSDFVGLARRARQREDADCLHLYFTGCAGNIAAGKYNDGSPQARTELVERMLAGIRASEADLRPEPIGQVAWNSVEILAEAKESIQSDELEAQIADKSRPVVGRNRPAYMLSWLHRLERKQPFVLGSLAINQAALLHLPAECFIEYQLRAQQMAPQTFLATAAYGDCGPWYIPTKEEYPHGGYEVGASFCAASTDGVLTDAVRRLLT